MTLLVLIVGAIAALWLYEEEKGGGVSAVSTGSSGSNAETNASGQNYLSNLNNIAQAIFQYEGGNPGNLNVINNKPGNLRSGANMTGTNGGYATFGDIGDGWDDLNEWIESHAATHPDWDFYDLFSYS